MKIKVKKGFLLTEVMLTIVIIAIAMLAITPVLFVGSRSGKIMKKKSVEINIAQREIETFKQKDFSTIRKEIETKINDSANFDKFLNGVTPFKFFPDPSATQFVNPNTGEIKDSASPGFFPLVITRNYYALNDSTSQWGETIQLNVSVQVQQPDTKPVTISAILTRDTSNK
ncbi:MAG: type II secretion system protein [Cyanobacteriota bacterium]